MRYVLLADMSQDFSDMKKSYERATLLRERLEGQTQLLTPQERKVFEAFTEAIGWPEER